MSEEQNTDPWATTETESPATPASDNPWESSPPETPADDNPWDTGTTGDDGGSSWLDAAPTEPVEQASFDWLHPFQDAWIPLDVWVEQGLDWVVDNFRSGFQAVRAPIDTILTGVEQSLLFIPAPLLILLVALLAWQVSGWRLGLGSLLSLIGIGAIGAWNEAMITLSLVLTSVVFCVLIGLPMGIWLGYSNRAQSMLRPVLDAMQTTPAFVYLVPIVMLFGIGNVPGVVVTIIFALPPLIRLTSLGIRQVPEDLVEATRSFGASPAQLLFKVQLPLAMPTIMAGINQTLMLALSMVVIASMIAVGGLGQMVLRGIGRLDMGLATVGGLGIVLMAIILDRLTQSMGQDNRSRGIRHWYETGPAGVFYRLLGNKE